MKIVLLGAGQVGATIVEALHDDHEVTVVDLDAARLQALSYRYDVRTVKGNGATRRVLQEAGIERADAHDRLHVAGRDQPRRGHARRRSSRTAQTIVRTSNPEYLEAWQERQIDVDFMVSSELETAHAVSRTIGVPAAKQTDVFAEGQVQIVEFDVPRDAGAEDLARPAHQAGACEPAASAPTKECAGRCARRRSPRFEGGEHHPRRPGARPAGDESILPGDRIIVIGSPDSARQWSRLMARGAAARGRRRHLRRRARPVSRSPASSSTSGSASA